MYTSPCSVPPLVGSPNGPTKTEPREFRENICFLNCLYKWKVNFCATRRWLSKRKNTSAPYFFDFPGLTSVLDLDPGFGCFSSRRVERTYIYLPGLPKKPGCHKPPFAGLGPPTGSPENKLDACAANTSVHFNVQMSVIFLCTFLSHPQVVAACFGCRKDYLANSVHRDATGLSGGKANMRQRRRYRENHLPANIPSMQGISPHIAWFVCS